MLNWLKQFNIFCLLDSQGYQEGSHGYEYLAAAGVRNYISGYKLEQLDAFLTERQRWAFGHLSYRLKDQLFPAYNSREDPAGFPPLYFFEPEVVVTVVKDHISIWADEPDSIWQLIIDAESAVPKVESKIGLDSRLSRTAYIQTVELLRQHMLRGDCYEINFCQEFYAADISIDPVAVFHQLTQLSPNPFSAFYRLQDKYLLCASPERFLNKRGSNLLSQPIKGTIRRNRNDAGADEELKRALAASTKDRAENVMVVDLVRNDLSRICTEGSVRVSELFGIYSFPQVHQMISTIRGTLRSGAPFSDIVRATFPMGSMTGAPKLKVMELIDRYEPAIRGIFSGSVGYFTPEGDFDLNVVIRSLIYNHTKRYLSCPAGSGITYYSDPEKEWEECLLKAEAMKKVLSGNEK